MAVKVTVAISAMQSLIQEKNLQINISPMRAGGKLGENILLVKISGCTVVTVTTSILHTSHNIVIVDWHMHTMNINANLPQ